MAAAYSTSQGSGIADGGSTTRDSPSTVVPSGNVCYVFVQSSDGTPAAPSGVKWDPTGVNETLTQIGTTITHGTFAKSSVWRGVSLTAKTGIFRATWGSSQGERLVNVWVGTGIDTGTPNGTVVQNQGTNTSVTTGAITTTAGQLVLALAGHLATSGNARTYNSPSGTERQDFVTSGTAYDGAESQDVAAAGSSTTITATLSGTVDSWAVFGIPLNDSGGGGGSTIDPHLFMTKQIGFR